MDLTTINTDLSSLTNSKNGCEYTDLNDGVINKITLGNEVLINVLHLNIRSFNKNNDNLFMLLNELREKGLSSMP